MVTLTFTTVLDELQRGLVDEDEAPEVVDRGYWEARGSTQTVAEADRVLGLIRSFAPGVELRYNKHYIGFWKDGQAYNFAVMRPRKTVLNLDIRLPRADEREHQLEQAGLDLLDYDKRWGAYRIRFSIGDLSKHGPLVTEFLQAAFEARGA